MPGDGKVRGPIQPVTALAWQSSPDNPKLQRRFIFSLKKGIFFFALYVRRTHSTLLHFFFPVIRL